MIRELIDVLARRKDRLPAEEQVDTCGFSEEEIASAPAVETETPGEDD